MNKEKLDLQLTAEAEANDYTEIIKDDDICTSNRCRILFAVVTVSIILVLCTGSILFFSES